MNYLLLGVVVFLATLAALMVQMVIDRAWRWTRADKDDEAPETLSPAIGFVMSRELWEDPE